MKIDREKRPLQYYLRRCKEDTSVVENLGINIHTAELRKISQKMSGQ